MKTKIQKALVLLAALFSAFTLGSLLGQFYWMLDILSHYHIQYTIVLTLLLLALLWLRYLRPLLLVPALALLVNLYLVVPFFLPPSSATAHAAADGSALRLMALNISTSNAGYEKVVTLIRARQPDLVFMSEVREDLLAVLRTELTAEYPYLHAEPSRMTLGVAFLSRRPFLQVETVMPGGRGRRYLRAVIDWQGQPVTVVGIHPLPPMRGAWAESRNSEIALMGEVANATAEPFVLLGDLNASPWSTPMRRLMASTDLRYAMQGYGVWPTWRLAGPLLAAPLDYVLVSPAWQVVDYVEGGDIGSDHVPVQADLVLNEAWFNRISGG
ncbi:MAG TPA: endonuclease/exonuclease/phosphatase family protein [Caldilineaceae bacterium]|nr:endonuclease/exonuclease/phosphatase family protein [Caldilineaceae bacterium]